MDLNDPRRRLQVLNNASPSIRIASQPQQKLTVAKAPTQPQPQISIAQPKQYNIAVPKAPAPDPSVPNYSNKFKDLTSQGTETKRLFGLDVGQFMGDFGKVTKISAGRDYESNADDFIKSYDGLNDDARRIYVDDVIKKAKEGDQVALNTAKVLNDKGKLTGTFGDFLKATNTKAFGWTMNGANFGHQKDVQEQLDNFTAGQIGKEFDPITVGTDIGLTIAGGAGAAKLLSKIPAAARVIEAGGMAGKALPFLADSIGGGLTQEAISQARGRDTSFAQDMATGTAIDVGANLVFKGAGKFTNLFRQGEKSASVIDDIIKEADPAKIQQVMKIDNNLANYLAQETNPDTVKEVLRQMDMDPNIQLPDEVRKRLEEEGISAVRKKDNQYGAEYDPNDSSINFKDQSFATDENTYHELGHHIYKNKLTPEEQALFKGSGEASQKAAGREGYTQTDVNSEDFSDYMQKALTGRIKEVPEELRPVIAKYAKTAANEAEDLGIAGAKAVDAPTTDFKTKVNSQVGKTEGAVPDSNVLKSYAGNDFTQINTHVKGRTLEQMDKRVRDKVEVLDSNMVDDIPAGTYYRGMVLTQSEIDNMVKTGKFKNDGYSSTSTDVQVADRFTQSRRPWIKDEKPVIFQLDVKDGQKGIDLTKISKESARDNEKLLPRNAEYIIKNVSEVDGKYIVDAEYVTTPTPPAPQVGKTDRIKANNGPGKDIIKLPLYNLKKMIYNKDVLTERLRNELEQARKSGQIDEATYQATLIGTKGLESKVGQDVGRAFEKNKQQQQNPVQNQPIVGQDLSGAAQQSHLGKSTNIHDEIPVDRKFTEEQHIQIEKLNDKYVKHFNDLKLNDSQVKDLSRVKGSYYKDVSSYLRDSNAYSDKNKFSLNHLNTDTINKHVAGIDAIFNKPETKIPNDLTVYRGIRSRGIFTKDIVGKTITDNAFMSTSIDPLTARHFSDAQMNNTVKMVLPEGTKAIYTDGLIKPLKTSFGNNFSREHEMLLPRGSSMKILEKKTYNDKYGSHNYYTAEYIPPEQSIQPTKPSLFKNESGAVGMGNNTEPTIHNPFTGKEIPNPNYVKPQNTPIVGPDLNIKQSKFAQGAAKSAEISSELQKQIKESAPTYQGGNNAEQVKTAEAYVKKGYQKATTEVTSTLEKKMGTITPQESANTIAVIKELDKRGGTANLQKATDLTNKLSEHLTAAGQTVQSASLLSNRTPEGLLYGARKFLKSNGVEVTPEIQKQLSDHVNAIRKLSGDARLNEIAKMQNTVEHLVPSSNLDKVIGLWKAGLLTGVKTQTGNTLSGIATNVMKTASDAPAALLDQGFAAFGKTNAGKKLGFTGERSKAFTMRGKASGVIEGGKKGLTALKTGIDERNLEANKFDTKRLVFSNSPAGKAAQKYTDTIYGMMGAADRPNFYANLRNNLYDLAIVDAKNKGLKGPTKEAHIQKFIKEPPMRATEIANKAANTAIFANDTALSRIAGGIIKKAEEAGPGVGAAAKVALPFTKVPSAVATRLIDYSPLGAVKTVAEQIKNVKKGGVLDQRALSEGLAQAGVGTGTMWLGMQLHDNGLMTGSYPTDQKERELWKLEGKQPNSIKVNGKWLSFNYTSPAGQILAVGGKINEAKQKGANLGDQATAGAFAIPKTVSEQSFLQGISGIQDAINDPEKQGAKFFKSQASSVVPTLSSDIAKATDPLQRQSNNVKEAIQAKIPVLNKKLLPKQDAFGAPMPRQSSSTNTLVNPFRPSDVRPTNDLNAELRRLQDQKLGVIPDSTDKQLKFGKTTVNLTPQQLFDKNVFVGQAVKDNWGKIIKTPEYAKMSDSEKQKVLRNVLTDVDALSKADFAAKNNPTLLDETKLTKNQVNLAQGNADYLKTKATTKSTKPKTVKVTKTKSTSKSARSIASNKYNFAKIMTTGIGSSSELRNIVKSSKIVRKKVKR